ncbi:MULTISPECIES: flagellar filament capping protein FliD [unclassified Pseudodesulfovibrio]|uniref:flagellar filament capping protein FliD n=1 Tax=unclassified Pseudodesulfovibrio TaxID=2661612 RepID=UPI000FEBCB39|nr:MULTISPECIES: flagellar filament capping protein FliD [unclassified Pseudodesulfovibrio]MCJ2163119.1 flagellar filament capping protein FliD [Pseudodesulfovibrio sp. S3-i]RWU07111.1 flagellar hook protein [Pseudodesulfovibrio sp. S3]
MAEYTSGAINFTGLGNGTDFNTLIEGLVKVEQTRVTRLENWKATWETKNEQFKALNTAMLGLKTTLEGFNTLNEFMTKAVSSSKTDLLTATGNADALESTHTVEINQLATNDILITTSGASSLTSSITSSTTSFTFSYGGKSYTINDISAGTTLEGFVNIINNHTDSRNRIQASTVFDGTSYHLQLSGKDLGADHQLVISNAGSLIFGAGDFTQTQDAQNSQIRVDGFPASNAGWIERNSNKVDDVISGITLNLKEADPGSLISLTVTTDTQGIEDNVTKFVSSINEIRARIIALTKVDDEGEGSILTGNYGVDMVSQNLKNITAELGLGFSVWDDDTLSGDRYSALSQLGIMTDAEQGSETYGLLILDYEKLEEALDDDPLGVAKLFAAEASGESKSPDFKFNSLIDGTTKGGIYDVEVVSDGTKLISATINGEDAKVSGWSITGLTGDATGMALELNTTAAGTYTGEIAVKVGKTGEMIQELKELTKPFNEFTYEGGPLAVLQNNYKEIMDSIDDKIAYEEKRISKLETNLRLKYSRLDTLLGQYQLKQGQLESALAQLST